MDAIKFLEEAKRMCKSYEHCTNCPLEYYDCSLGAVENPQTEVEIVERWAKEHTKTRQSEFLKMFPNASQQDGLLNINPCTIDLKYRPSRGCRINCLNCRKEYWLAEVE